MYITKNEHIISRAICSTAFIRLFGEGANMIARRAINSAQYIGPDMLNSTITNFAAVVSIVQLILISGVFYLAFKRLEHLRTLFPKDEYVELAKIQEEMASEHISSISLYSITQLLQLWAAVLIGVQIIYDVTSRAYQDFIAQIYLLIDFSDQNIADAFVSVYNNTHGFKYIGMFIAISLAVFVTGVFLKDSFLKILAFVILAMFMLAFEILQMNTVMFFDRSVGIVWTSVIYHMIQTGGLFGFAIYLSKKYRGL